MEEMVDVAWTYYLSPFFPPANLFGSLSERNRPDTSHPYAFFPDTEERWRGRGKIDYGNSKKLGHSVWLPLPPAFFFTTSTDYLRPDHFQAAILFFVAGQKLETHPKLFVFQSSLCSLLLSPPLPSLSWNMAREFLSPWFRCCRFFLCRWCSVTHVVNDLSVL